MKNMVKKSRRGDLNSQPPGFCQSKSYQQATMRSSTAGCSTIELRRVTSCNETQRVKKINSIGNIKAFCFGGHWLGARNLAACPKLFYFNGLGCDGLLLLLVVHIFHRSSWQAHASYYVNLRFYPVSQNAFFQRL